MVDRVKEEIVLAEYGRFPLQVHFWQQILRYHHRVVALDNSRLVKLAMHMVDGCTWSEGNAYMHYVCAFPDVLHMYPDGII